MTTIVFIYLYIYIYIYIYKRNSNKIILQYYSMIKYIGKTFMLDNINIYKYDKSI